MLHIMSTAFFRTVMTDIGAHLTKRSRMVAIQRHQLRCHPANRCTLRIERNTSRHFIYILLLQTSHSTMVTSDGAFQACIDA
jgi:hypothetical protein